MVLVPDECIREKYMPYNDPVHPLNKEKNQ